MFTKSAQWYDAIYAWKDYTREAERLHALIQQHARQHATTLLDVACGTGQHGGGSQARNPARRCGAFQNWYSAAGPHAQTLEALLTSRSSG